MRKNKHQKNLAKAPSRDPLAIRTKSFHTSQLANEYLESLKLKDLKREVVARGMPFEKVAEGYIPALQGFFMKNCNSVVVKERIHEYDAWLNDYLVSLGDKPLHPMLQLGSVIEIDEETGEQILRDKKMKGFSKEKKKVEKNNFGVRAGTAKAYVGYCAEKGLSLEATTKRVQARFERGTNAKSIKIWYKKFSNSKNESK